MAAGNDTPRVCASERGPELFYEVTLGGAETSFTCQLPYGWTRPIVSNVASSGTAVTQGPTFVASTGVLTVGGCTATDIVYFSVRNGF